jgi:phosphoenolpyruvate synthase/pyruvate phosphate dikinase
MRGRPYSATVYLIQPEGTTTPVYVMMEMPSILYVVYEMNTIGQKNSSIVTNSLNLKAVLNSLFLVSLSQS